jgi:hypothetical protein
MQRRKTTLASEEELVHFHPKHSPPSFQGVKGWLFPTLFDSGDVIPTYPCAGFEIGLAETFGESELTQAPANVHAHL